MTRMMTGKNLSGASEAAAPRTARDVIRGAWDRVGMLLLLVIIFGCSAVFVENFLTSANMIGLVLSVSIVGMIACTMLFCLASGDFDLSVGSVVAMSGVLAAEIVNQTGSVPLAVGGAVLAGGMVGLVNGTVIARIGINALITTLATMQMVRGLSYIVTDGKAVGIREQGFFVLGNSSMLSVPTPIWIMAGCFLVFGLLLNKTTFGRNTLAVGGNKEAARLAGIPVTRVKIMIFVLQGLVSGLAGVVLASRMNSGQPAAGQGMELQAISACVLGGVSLTGGVGTIGGTVVGVLIMSTVQNVMSLMNIPTFYQYVVSGGILLTAVLLDRLRHATMK